MMCEPKGWFMLDYKKIFKITCNRQVTGRETVTSGLILPAWAEITWFQGWDWPSQVPCQENMPTCTTYNPMLSESTSENHIIGSQLPVI